MKRRALLASLPPLLAASSTVGLPLRAIAQQQQQQQPAPQGGSNVAPLAPRQQPPLPLAKPGEVGLDPERLGRIRPFFEAEVAENRLPGAVVMIARRGRLAYSETFGFRDRQNNASMAADAVFRLYSMTKPLTTVAATMLMEEGRIGLADPVGKYLPGFDRLQVSVAQGSGASAVYEAAPTQRPMLVYDLLRHTSGLAYGELTQNAPVRDAYTRARLYLPGQRDYDSRGPSPQEFVQGLAQAPLARQPGTTWEYGLSIDALGRVVEAAAGKRMEEFLEERLFRPLRMVDAGFSLRGGQGERLAIHSGVDPANNQPVSMIDVSRPPGNASGGAGGLATAGDYLRFAQMLANGGSLDGARILSPAAVRLMTSDHIAGLAQPLSPGMLLFGSPGYGFGFGMMVRLADGGALVPGYAGQFMWAGWSGTYFWVDPKAELVGVMMTAAPSVARGGYRRLMMQLAYAAVEA